MHMYYTEFDWLPRDELETLLPEDGVPSSLAIHDIDEEDNRDSLTSHAFQQWLWEGRHDCEVALAFLRLFASATRGRQAMRHSPISSFSCMKTIVRASTRNRLEGVTPMVPVISSLPDYKHLGHVPFDVTGVSREDVHAQLVQQIWEEVHCVEAYVSTWSGSTCVPQPERHLLSDTIVRCMLAICAAMADD